MYRRGSTNIDDLLDLDDSSDQVMLSMALIKLDNNDK